MICYVGLDVSTKETAICVIDEAGERPWAGKVRTDPDAIAAALARHAAAALKLQMTKTDRNDAYGLARLVRSGWHRPVAVRSLETRKLRVLLVTRDRLVGMSTALINKIRGMAKTFGLLIGPGKCGTFEHRVPAQIPDDPVLGALFESLLTLPRTLRERRDAIAAQLSRVARQDRICRLMMTMPGVGPLTAMSFMTAIEDPRRFRRSQDMGAYLGMTPRRSQSGEADINGRISKCGDRLTSKLLFEAANAMLSRCSQPMPLRDWGTALAQRSGFWKARVALARKLAVILHRMWLPDVEGRAAL